MTYAFMRCPGCHRQCWFRADAPNCGMCEITEAVRVSMLEDSRFFEPLVQAREDVDYQEMDQ